MILGNLNKNKTLLTGTVTKYIASEQFRSNNFITDITVSVIESRTTKLIWTSDSKFRWEWRELIDSFCHKIWTRKDIQFFFLFFFFFLLMTGNSFSFHLAKIIFLKILGKGAENAGSQKGPQKWKFKEYKLIDVKLIIVFYARNC